jgi:hypothetical protein
MHAHPGKRELPEISPVPSSSLRVQFGTTHYHKDPGSLSCTISHISSLSQLGEISNLI